MSVNCPYCGNGETHPYYSVELPFYVWPLSSGEENFMVPVEITLCPKCWYAFNSKPLSEDLLRRIYDNYDFVSPSAGIGHSLHRAFVDMVKENTKKEDNIVEIGSSDGYLLRQLYGCGYRNLGGIDPNPRIDDEYPIRIQKGYFTRDTNFESEVDVFLLEHVFEHLERPWEFLKVISEKLSKNGKILMEFPGYCNGMGHQHMSFFTIPFLQEISKHSMLSMNVIFHDSTTVTRIIFQKCDSVVFLTPTEIDEEKDKIVFNTGKIRQNFLDKKSKLDNFLKNAHDEEIYWWGAGSWAAILFSYMDPSLKNGSRFKVIDSDSNREGKIFFPADVQVFVAEKILKNADIKYLVLASQYKDEMIQKLSEWNCKVGEIFHV